MHEEGLAGALDAINRHESAYMSVIQRGFTMEAMVKEINTMADAA